MSIETQIVQCNECCKRCKFWSVDGSCYQHVIKKNMFEDYVDIYPKYEITNNGVTVVTGTRISRTEIKNRPDVKLDFNSTGINGIVSNKSKSKKDAYGAYNHISDAPRSKLVRKALESLGK